MCKKGYSPTYFDHKSRIMLSLHYICSNFYSEKDMKKLLSLPPNVVEKFYDITRLTREEYYCTCDPIGHKLGSGGGTAWVLEKAATQGKRIVIHGGGQSRRLPAYAPSGKLLTPVPVFRWERGQRIDQTLLDLQLPLYEEIMERAPESITTLVASGDVLLRATEPLQEIPAADVVCYGLWAAPEQISHHGVFMMRRDNPSQLDFMLQKPSAEQQATLISMVVPLTRVWHRCAMESPVRIGNSREAESYCLSILAGERTERFYVVSLNAQCKVLGRRKISEGSLSEVSAYPRMVMETALNYNAHSVLLCHNHPGGTCAPSPEDITSTIQLQQLLNGVGILVLDHIIVANDKTYSMIQHGDIDYRIKRR